MSLFANAVPEFLGSIAATVAVTVVRWGASALRARASRARQAGTTRESGPAGP
ncbi:hypothetical protein [Streptomyces sp. bgisy153]|uniref:hypothetical protein n=1 Tax=Streptomyces sp. bgisy153 TaxID=3413793 RepID=UPI003D754F7C